MFAVQFSPKELSQRVSSVLQNGVRESGISPSRIIGITITSQRQAIALLRSDGSTMHIGPNRDLRAVFEGQAIDEELGPWIYSLTGHLPSFFFAPAKLHWWKKHHRRIFQKIHPEISAEFFMFCCRKILFFKKSWSTSKFRIQITKRQI